VAKYSPEGAEIWTDVHGGSGIIVRDTGNDVAIGDDLSIAVIGTEGEDIWVRKYGADGTVEWSDTYDGPGNDCTGECFYHDQGYGIAVDTLGNVVAVGRSVVDNDGLDDDTLVRKYDSSGAVLWTSESDPDGSAFDTYGWRVVAGSDQSIVVIGQSSFNDSVAGWVRKYAP
jgi:hypothetical protein